MEAARGQKHTSDAENGMKDTVNIYRYKAIGAKGLPIGAKGFPDRG